MPDPDLGWRVSTQHPIWLGLDACAVILAISVAVAIGAVILRRRDRARGVDATTRRTTTRRATALRAASWIVAVLPLAIPIAAFASGPGPLHGVDTLPPTSAVLVESGIEGSLDAPAGRYVVLAHPGTSLTAHLSAGGEAFDARFDHDITGAWHGDPRDLHQPMHADIAVAADAVDTGVGERTKHAREGYLHADEFPRITIALDHAEAVRAIDRARLADGSSGATSIAFRAPATVQLIGKTHNVEVTGTVAKPDAAALARLGVTGDVLLVQADLTLAIHETALAPNAGDFDGDRLPVHISLVLRRSP